MSSKNQYKDALKRKDRTIRELKDTLQQQRTTIQGQAQTIRGQRESIGYKALFKGWWQFLKFWK